MDIGGDAATIRPSNRFDLYFSADVSVRGRHLFEDVLPEDLVRKMLAVNLSGVVAMGVKSCWVLFSAVLPELNQD